MQWILRRVFREQIDHKNREQGQHQSIHEFGSHLLSFTRGNRVSEKCHHRRRPSQRGHKNQRLSDKVRQLSTIDREKLCPLSICRSFRSVRVVIRFIPVVSVSLGGCVRVSSLILPGVVRASSGSAPSVGSINGGRFVEIGLSVHAFRGFVFVLFQGTLSLKTQFYPALLFHTLWKKIPSRKSARFLKKRDQTQRNPSHLRVRKTLPS